ncbi:MULTISPECIES: GNAT family N-acetyltransferase [Nocardiaceae]|uniref:GNAT superfamily N-acetyltransferase n=1 Tax=Rhodococcoides corynebacterioides TaxID=53972 RepID=A0ABS2KVP0_9NOCA|nr:MULTISPECIES: GNAT family N-acetyltransferase [Rhodococcus]MBM7415999.1 GNAT superfamily N-acetyltransferase [Rhodococcus corynebacterioides]MBP1114252.1 GNAT superfamily N-acetyltransferase [Rhodococcus sp. PvP016]
MNSHQIDIVRLAWARELGLPDDASLDDAERLHVVDDDSTRLTFVVLDGHAVLVGPGDILDRAEAVGNDVLATRDGLAELAGQRRGRCGGPRVLAFLDDSRDDVRVEHPLISHDGHDVDRVLALVPPDDATGIRAVGVDSWFTVFDDADGEDDALPAAAAGYVEWRGFLADTVAVTVPSRRRRGYGSTAARLATNEAIDAGLVPQWSVPMDNATARLFGLSLGFTELGVHIAMELTDPG